MGRQGGLDGKGRTKASTPHNRNSFEFQFRATIDCFYVRMLASSFKEQMHALAGSVPSITRDVYHLSGTKLVYFLMDLKINSTVVKEKDRAS